MTSDLVNNRARRPIQRYSLFVVRDILRVGSSYDLELKFDRFRAGKVLAHVQSTVDINRGSRHVGVFRIHQKETQIATSSGLPGRAKGIACCVFDECSGVILADI
jgi:hypothetical protein